MPSLTGSQKKHLRGLAHDSKPVVRIGKAGLSEGLLASLDEALERHELVKVRFAAHKDRKREIADQIDSRLGCERVGLVGHVAIFYRRARDPEARRVEVPAAGAR